MWLRDIRRARGGGAGDRQRSNPGPLEEKLQELADELGDEVLVDGVLYRRHEPGSVTYHSPCGGMPVHRDSERLCSFWSHFAHRYTARVEAA